MRLMTRSWVASHCVASHWAAGVLLALPLAVFACLPVWSEEAATGEPPKPVTDAIAAARAPDDPAKVVVGAYINDIQELDFKTNSYAIDLYVWFRWRPGDLEPNKTMEFMNRYAPNDDVRDNLYDQPKPMPDGSLYSIIRNQGRFSTKFPLEKYPFDRQFLLVTMEDTITGADKQIYVSDADGGVSINPDITLPGFSVGTPLMRITAKPYPTILAISPSRRRRLIRA